MAYFEQFRSKRLEIEMKMRRRAAHIFPKATDGFYVEPSWVSRRLFEVEDFSGQIIYDPACGWGTILKAAIAAGYGAIGSDIIDRKRHQLGEQFHKYDFLTWRPATVVNNISIVCNPPFDHVGEFCLVALEGARKVRSEAHV